MKITVTESIFIDYVRRLDRVDQFDLDGWRALFEHIEDCERDTGEEAELDIVGLCCDWTRYESIAEFNAAYDEECADFDDVADLTSAIQIPNSSAFLALNY